MSTMKFLLIGIASVHACTDSYATPDHGGDYCSGFSAFSDGQNCWGDCVTGCPAIQPCSPGPCYMETRDISTQGSCIWPANTKLCCAHVNKGGLGWREGANMTLPVKEPVKQTVEAK